jgi:hypothetical protein
MLEYELNGKIYTEEDLIKAAGGKDKLPAYIKSKGFKPASKKTKQPAKFDERFGEDTYKKTFGFENPAKDQFSEINKTKKKLVTPTITPGVDDFGAEINNELKPFNFKEVGKTKEYKAIEAAKEEEKVKEEPTTRLRKYEKPKEQDNDFFNYLKEGLDLTVSTITKSFYKAPEYAYEAQSAIAKPIAKAIGGVLGIELAEEEDTSARMMETLGIKNVPADILQKRINESNKVIKEYSDKNGVDPLTAIENGNYLGAAKLIAGGTVQSLPWAVAAFYSGGSSAAMGTIATSSAISKSEQLKEENPEMTVENRIANSAVSGALEGYLAQLFTGASGNVVKKIIADKGSKAGSKIISNGIKGTLEKAIEKNPMIGILGEVAEESTVEFGDQLNDMNSGIRKELDYRRIANSGIIATGMSGTNTVPVYAAKGYMKAVEYNQVKKVNKEINSLTNQLSNPYISDPDKKIISARVNRLVTENKAIVGSSLEKISALPESVKTELNTLNSGLDDLKSKYLDLVDNKELPLDVKKAMGDELTLQAKEIQDRKTSIIEGNYIYEDFKKLPDAEQDRIKVLANETLIANSELTDDPKTKFNEDEIKKEAINIYNAELRKANVAKEIDLLSNLTASEVANIKNGIGENKIIEVFDTPEDLQNAYNKYHADNKFEGAPRDVTKEAGFALGDQMVINKTIAENFEEGDSVGRHELLHKILKSSFSDKEAGVKLKNKFLNVLSTKERSVIEKRLSDRGYTEEDLVNAPDEYLTQFFEALDKKEIKYSDTSFLTMWKSFLQPIYKKLGFRKLDFKSGTDVYNFIKDYHKSTKIGQLSKRAIALKEKGLDTGIKEAMSKTSKELKIELEDLKENEGDYDPDDFDQQVSNLEGKIKRAIEKEKSGIAPVVKKEVSEEEADKEIIKNEKGTISSDKVQKIYEEKGLNGAQDIINLFKPITRRLVNRRRDAPGFDEELLRSEIETGDGGLLYLIRSYKHEKGVPLAAYINKQLPLRAIAASRRVLDKDFSKDVTEEKGLIAEETVSEAKEKPKYKNALESNVFTPEILKTATGKIITIVRTLKNRIDAPVTLNRTVTPLISEIRDEVGKQLDIDIKTMLGGKKDGVLKKELLRNKKYILENMTTTWLMGKDGQGGIPQAIQKQIDGKFVSFPDWVGQKIDREKTTTDQAGRTSGAELVRRLPNVNNNVSNEDFLAQIIGPDGNPIRGRKESLSKAMAEEGAFDIINADFAEEGPIFQAFATNQQRLGYEIASNTVNEFVRQSDRGNIKSSKVYNNFSEQQKELFNNNINQLSIELNPLLNNINKDISINRIFHNILDPLLINGKKAFVRDEIDALIIDFIPWLRQMRDIDKSVGLYLEDENFDFNKFIENIAIADNEIPLSALNMPDIEKGLYSANNVNSSRDVTKNMFRYWYDTLGPKESIKMMVYLNGNYKYNARLGKTIGLDVDELGVVFETGEKVPKNKSSKQIAKNADDYWDNLLYASLPGGKSKVNIDLVEKIKSETANDRKTDSASKAYRDKDYIKRKKQAEYYRNITEKMFEFYFNKENKISNADKAIMISQMNGSTESASRKSAILTYEYIAPEDESVGALRYEHMVPANKILASLVKAYTKTSDGKVSRETLDSIWKNYEAALIPVTMDQVFRKVYLESNMVPGWNNDLPPYYRYYNYATFGKDNLFPITNIFTGEIIGEKFVEASNAMRAGIKNNIKIDAITKSFISFSKTPKGISVFDFDDTVGLTKGSVLYAMPDGSTGKLNAEEFAKNGSKLLEEGAVFDFSEFSKVVDGRPGPMVEKMKKMIGKFGPSNFFILTARPADAAVPIHEFLNSIGINIPLENITGLGNSTAQAKADWMVAKAAEGYNDFYFSDDAIQNVTAVENALKVLDVKSKIQQAKLKFSKTMSDDFNRIIEENKNVESYKVYSDITARRKGLKKNRFDFYVPPSAADFELLLYKFMGKGTLGEEQKKFFQDALINPYINGVDMMDAVRQSIKKEYKALLKSFPEIKKELEKLTPNKNFTYDQAMRVAIWNQYGTEIPGLSERDTIYLTDLINNDPDLAAFKDGLIVMGRQKEGWLPPGTYWDSDTIISDLYNITEGAGRKKFLGEFIENTENIFGKFENGRLSGPNINKVEAVYGTNVREALEDSIYRMINGKNRSIGQDKETTAWSSWVNGSTGAIMFMNTRSAALQMLGAVNFLNWRDNNPYNAGKAFLNQPQYWKDFARIWNSDKLKERRGGLREDVASAEIANAAAGSKNKVVAVTSYLLKIGYTPTQLADSFAIASGGAPFYRNRINSYLEEGLTEQEAESKAWKDFSKISDETQQSGDPKDISKQQSSAAGRILLVFQNFTMQQSRIVKKAVLDLKNGRGDAKTNISKIAYYLAVQNIMFSTLQQGLFAVMFDEDDEEDKKKKEKKKTRTDAAIDVANGVLDSILRGTGFIGGVAATLKNTVVKYLEEQAKKQKAEYAKVVLEAANMSPPIGSKLRKTYSALQQTKYDKDLIAARGWGVMQDGRVHLGPMYSVTGKLVEVGTNFPMDRLVNKVENVSQAFNSENTAMQRLATGMGYSPWTVGIEGTKGDILIKETAKTKRKEEGIIKAKETRRENAERLKDSIEGLSIPERREYRRKVALEKREKRKEKALEKREERRRKLEMFKKLNANK